MEGSLHLMLGTDIWGVGPLRFRWIGCVLRSCNFQFAFRGRLFAVRRHEGFVQGVPSEISVIKCNVGIPPSDIE